EDLEIALKLAKQAQILRPGALEVIDTLGWVYYKMGDIHRALGLLEKAVPNEAAIPILNYHMGMVLYKNGRLEEARERLKNALKNNKRFIGREEAERVNKEIEAES
ncbi:MAG: tetratricopeptide repeat protein, partial [Deltaproteobacteria bacterium]|nr:tetratricopeptide repeat protein [Deltaproteobacteria bacterium]